MKSKLKIQKSLGYKRPRTSAAISKEIALHLKLAKQQTGASKSFIQAVALAKFFGIKDQERFL